MAMVMQSTVNLIDDIVAGRVDWKLRVRVISLAKVPNPHNSSEIVNIEMILLDEKCSKITANVKRPWITKFINRLQEGSTYMIEKMLVAQNDLTFKKTNHKFKINFMGTTEVKNITAPDIPLNHFDFCDFPTILQEERKDLFIDIIGHVIEKDTIREKQMNGRLTLMLEIVLEDLGQHHVKCTLWGDYAQKMQTELENVATNAVIVVCMQRCRVSQYMGKNGISSALYGTKMFINVDIPEINDYKSRLEFDAAVPTLAVSQMIPPNTPSIDDELLRPKKMTIAELIEATENCVGSLLVKVIEIDMEHGWNFNSCNTCFRAANKCENRFYCQHCKTLVTATPRYKLHLQVIDDTGSTTFLLFNQLVTAYVGRSAVDLIRNTQNRPSSYDTPAEFLPLLDKQFLFKVEVTDSNTVRGFQTYVVKKLSCDADIIQKFIQLNAIEVSNTEQDSVYTDPESKVEDSQPVVNLDGDTPPEVFYIDLDETPPLNNKNGKRAIAEFDGINLNAMEFSPESVTKMAKSVVKIEPKE